MSSAYDYAAQHAHRFVDQLLELLRIPSVSTDPAYKGEVQRAAEWIAEDMRRIGLDDVQIIPTAGHPLVYGQWLKAGLDKPTLLIYGHYDVQPAEIADGWTSDPFEPVIREGRVVARGASDDKGQVMIHLKAIEALLASSGCPVNVKYLIEGEEETSTVNLERFIRENSALLRADICLISDTNSRSLTQPEIVYGLRGLMCMEVVVSGPRYDLHSGRGGMIHNPAQALCEIIAALHDEQGRVAVPGFYDAVKPLSDEERVMLQRAEWTDAEWQAMMGDLPDWGEAGYNKIERSGARPTLEVNGISSGYNGEGFKTVLPARASAKLSCRLVPDQDPQVIYELVKVQIERLAPPTVRVSCRQYEGGRPAITPLNHPAMQAAVRAYARQWSAPMLFTRGGGSIPVVATIQQYLKLPVVLMGFGLPDSAAHGPDENFHLEMFHKGIATVIAYMHEVAT
ncbi:MAG: dipeptidase [Anaerolineae bacterium]|nr:dipeptidase [Anaerolineae bacterium]